MNKYSFKKIAALVAFGLIAVAVASVTFIGKASAAAPDVQTLDATDIFDDSATLNGYLYTQGEDTTYWFEYGTNRNNLNQETSHRFVGDRDGRVTVSNTIRNGLIPGRIYYFRLIAENRDGIDRGEILDFEADNDDGGSFGRPEVSTDYADPSNYYAVLNGSVDPNGEDTRVWFRWGQSRSSLNFVTNSNRLSGTSFRTFSQTISNLLPGTYYYQAVAENEDGVDYGDVLSFSTTGSGGNPGSSQAPLANTNSALVSGNSSATLRGQVNPNGNLSSVWFEYGRIASLGRVTTRDPVGSSNTFSDYSVTLNGLTPGTTYYYRVVAQSSAGITRGQVLTFRTGGVVVVNPPTNPNGDNGGNGGNGGSTPPPPTTPINETPVGAPGCFTVSPMLADSQLSSGGDFSYSVTYRNDCGYALSAGSLRITLPAAAEYADTNYPFLSRDGNVITYNLGVIAPSFQSAVAVNGKVRSQVATGDSLIFQADLTFTNPNGLLQTASGYLSAVIVSGAEVAENGSSTLAASAADALSGLFHSGWFWLILFLILIALFVFWLATRRRGDDEDEDEEVASSGH